MDTPPPYKKSANMNIMSVNEVKSNAIQTDYQGTESIGGQQDQNIFPT